MLRIRVFDEGTHRATQELVVPRDEAGEWSSGPPRTDLDLDFDGYKDLMVRSYAGANNAGYFVWIFEPRRRAFRYCPELRDQPNLQPDPGRRVLTSLYHFSAGEGSRREFVWRAGKPILVREDTRAWRRDTTCLEQVTRKRVRGRMVEVRRGCE